MEKLNSLMAFIKHWTKNYSYLAYEIDSIVIKVDRLSVDTNLYYLNLETSQGNPSSNLLKFSCYKMICLHPQ